MRWRNHIDHANCLDPRLWWFDSKKGRGLAGLNAAPELSFRRDNEVLIERISVGLDLDPFSPTGNNRKHCGPCSNHPHVVLELRHVLFAGGLFRE